MKSYSEGVAVVGLMTAYCFLTGATPVIMVAIAIMVYSTK